MTNTELRELIARLLAVDSSGDDWIYGEDYGVTCSYRNPDGPEAVTALQSYAARVEELEKANSKLVAWLYDACDGFPVSQEAFDAFTADDLKAVGDAVASRTGEQFTTLAEFRAKVERMMEGKP